MTAPEGGPAAVTTGPTQGPATGGAPPLAPDDRFQDALAAALAPALVVERELTGGGMARVFVAHEAALGRRVVVKVLPPELAAGVNRERFRREVQLAAQLQHPHVVPLLAAGEVGAGAGAPEAAGAAGSLYYTMPFIEGESLRAEAAARAARGEAFAPREVRRVLHDIADALSYAHARGVVHRDVKPGNVLLQHGHALVTDFGVAKALAPGGRDATTTSMTALGMAIGTPAYMAPEQLAADPAADHRVDLYAAGLVAYELLAGASPFAEASPQATLAAQLTRVPPPIATVRPDVPPALAAAVTRCLAKDPADRPASAAALLALLDGADAGPASGPTGSVSSALAGGAATADVPATSAMPATVRTRRRGGRRAVLGLAGAAVAVGAGVWATRGGPRAPAARVDLAPAAPTTAVAVSAPATSPPSAAGDAAAPRLSHADSVAIAAAVTREFQAALSRQRPPRAPAPAPGRPTDAGVGVDGASPDAAAVRADARATAAAAVAARTRVIDSLVQGNQWGRYSREMLGAVVRGLPVHAGGFPPEARRELEATLREFRVPPVPPAAPGPPGVSPALVVRFRALAALAGELGPPRPGARRVALVGLRDATGEPAFRVLAPALDVALRARLGALGRYDLTDPGTGAVARRERAPDGVLAAFTGAGAVVRGEVALEGDVAAATLVVTDVGRGTQVTVAARVPAPPDAPVGPVIEALADPLARALADALGRVAWGAARAGAAAPDAP